MTADLKILLDTLDQLKAQHRAGITPHYGQLEDLFESAAAVRRDMTAIASGLTPPAPRPVAAPVTLERVTCTPIRMTVDFGQAARAVLEGLPTASGV